MVLAKIAEHIDYQSVLIGFFTLFTTFGFKYIHSDLDDEIEELLNSELMRKFYIFSFIYLATKNVVVSVIILILYSLSLWYRGRKPRAPTSE